MECKTVRARVSTHNEGGITANDFFLADAADGHYASITSSATMRGKPLS